MVLRVMRAVVAVVVMVAVLPLSTLAAPPFNPACPTPIPSAATFNNLVPDVTDVPLPVTVSLQPIQITDIDAKAQTFGLSAYLFMSWQDSRLAFNATNCNRGKDRYVLTGTRLSVIWRPQIEFPNARSRTVSPEEVNVYQDGFCLYVGRIQLVLNADINVLMFPFDEHDLRLTMREFDLPSEELVLVADVGNSVMTVRESSQFQFDPTMVISHSTFRAPARNKTWDQLTFTFHAKRMYLATLFNNLLPVFFITSVGVFSFYLPRAVSSASQTIITTTAFLAAMAFSVTLQSTLPAVRYLTRANILVIISYTINFLSFCFAVVTGALSTKVDAIYKAEDALRAKAAEQAAKASAASASGGDAAPAPAPSRPSGGEMELTSLLPGQMRTPLAGAGAGAATSSAPAPPVVGGMMGAVVAVDADGGGGAGAGNARLYAADAPAPVNKNVINGKQLVPRRRRKQLLASYFGVLCKCHARDEPLAVRLQSLADTISFVARVIVPPLYIITAFLLFNV